MTCVIGLDIGTTSTIGILIGLPDTVVARRLAPGDAVLAASGLGGGGSRPSGGANACAILRELMSARRRPAEALAGDLRHRHAAGRRPSRRRGPAAAPEHPAERRALRGRGRASSQPKSTRPPSCARTGNGINQQLVARQAALARAARAGDLRADRDRLRLLRLRQLAADRRARHRAELGARSRLRRSRRRTRSPTTSWRSTHICRAAPFRARPCRTSVLGTVTAPRPRRRPACRRHCRSSAGPPTIIASALAAGLTRAGRRPPQVRRLGRHHRRRPNGARPTRASSSTTTSCPASTSPNGCMATVGLRRSTGWPRPSAAASGGRGGSRPDDPPASRSPRRRDAGRQPTACSVLPYFLGEKTPIQDPAAPAAPFTGLSLGHGSAISGAPCSRPVAYGFAPPRRGARRHRLRPATLPGLGRRRATARSGCRSSPTSCRSRSSFSTAIPAPASAPPGPPRSASASPTTGPASRASSGWRD